MLTKSTTHAEANGSVLEYPDNYRPGRTEQKRRRLSAGSHESALLPRVEARKPEPSTMSVPSSTHCASDVSATRLSQESQQPAAVELPLVFKNGNKTAYNVDKSIDPNLIMVFVNCRSEESRRSRSFAMCDTPRKLFTQALAGHVFPKADGATGANPTYPWQGPAHRCAG